MTGPEIRALRERLGYSVKQFAEALGVRPNTVYSWELDYRIPMKTAEILMSKLEPIYDIDRPKKPRRRKAAEPEGGGEA